MVENGTTYVSELAQNSGQTANNFTSPVNYVVTRNDGTEEIYKVTVTESLPQLYIDTDSGDPITSKDDRVWASLRINGVGEYPSYEGPTEIRGRGNSTWAQPKKPYQLKLDSKEQLFELTKAKKWILLANYLDITLMGNAIAMETARLLDLPFTHTIIPVDVTVNGELQGSYMFTEEKEVAKGRIETGTTGAYIELDTHDKSGSRHEFTSPQYELPVIIKDPKLKDSDQAFFDEVETKFNALEALIAAPDFPNNGYRDLIDIDSLAKYPIVFYVSANREINHPKSVYMYTVDESPFYMGPVWDFDWAWGYDSGTPQQFRNPNIALLSGSKPGTQFFNKLISDPVVKAAIRTEWDHFYSNHYAELVSYTETYAKLIEASYLQDFDIWASGAASNSSHRQRLRQPDFVETELPRIIEWLNSWGAYLNQRL